MIATCSDSGSLGLRSVIYSMKTGCNSNGRVPKLFKYVHYQNFPSHPQKSRLSCEAQRRATRLINMPLNNLLSPHTQVIKKRGVISHASGPLILQACEHRKLFHRVRPGIVHSRRVIYFTTMRMLP